MTERGLGEALLVSLNLLANFGLIFGVSSSSPTISSGFSSSILLLEFLLNNRNLPGDLWISIDFSFSLLDLLLGSSGTITSVSGAAIVIPMSVSA